MYLYSRKDKKNLRYCMGIYNNKTINYLKLLLLRLCLFILGEYDARQRVLARELAKLLNVPFNLIELYEHSIVKLLSSDVDAPTE